MNRYLKIDWKNGAPADPATYFCEIDDEGWELRRVEIFQNGKMAYADRQLAVGCEGLGLAQVPSLSKIRQDPEIEAWEISENDFDFMWEKAKITNSPPELKFSP